MDEKGGLQTRDERNLTLQQLGTGRPWKQRRRLRRGLMQPAAKRGVGGWGWSGGQPAGAPSCGAEQPAASRHAQVQVHGAGGGVAWQCRRAGGGGATACALSSGLQSCFHTGVGLTR